MRLRSIAAVLVLALLTTSTIGHSSQPASSPFAGTWDAEMNGLPGVKLTIANTGDKISGTIVFYLQKRQDVNTPWQVAGEYREAILAPRTQGQTLTFEVRHHTCHGCTEFSPNVHFRVDLTGPDEARMRRREDGDDSPGYKLVRAGDSDQADRPWHDPSPHQVQLVPVEDGVQLEVLDWGGTGRPIVLLAGYLTAHAYDDFAPLLTQIGHVYGITRRGFGASSRPASGYTSQRLSEDIVRVLDLLKLSKPILIGHSFGGQDQTILAQNHPERIAALVYLNSAEDPTVTDYGMRPPDVTKLPAIKAAAPNPDFSSFQAYRAWEKRTHGIAFPEAELRQRYAPGPDGTVGKDLGSPEVRQAMFKGLEKPDFTRIKVPVLAFFAAPISLEDEILNDQPQNEGERSAVEQQYRFDMAVRNRHMQDLKNGVPAACIVELSNANFYIFLSNQADLLRELQTFVEKLP